MTKHVGVIPELDGRGLKEADMGMITLARQKDTHLFALVLDGSVETLKEKLSSYGVSTLVDIRLAGDLQHNPEVRAKAVIGAVKKFGISAVFGLSTARGKDLLPRIAALLESPLVMDCFNVDLEANIAETSRYSGKTLAKIKVTGPVPIFGIRPNAKEPVREPVSAKIIQFDAGAIASTQLRVVKTGETGKGSKISLAEAEIIISGGRGMKNGENFTQLFQCAEKLNAAVGASRVAVDSGWVPYALQVGQTGEKVSPKVYIACGISGSIQHFAGMKTSGMVIAINLDTAAPIMSNCDYYAVADALEVVPELTKLLEKSACVT